MKNESLPARAGALLLCGLGVLCALPTALRAQNAPVPLSKAAPYRQDSVLVAFHPAAPGTARAGAVNALGLTVDPKVRNPHYARVLVPAGVRAQGASVETVLAALRRNPSVRVAEPDYIVSAGALPNDTRLHELWGLNNTGQTGGTPDADIDAAEAWNKTTGSDSVVVAVIDSGVDYNHPDLRDNILKDGAGNVVGYDFHNDDADPMDDNDHGTHCAGTIGARGNNSVGVVGVAHRVKIMPLKFLGASGSGSTSDAIDCVDYARTHGADVMSNSWSGGGYSQLMVEAIQRARDAGILFVAAASNGGDDGIGDDNDAVPVYPAGYDVTNVVSVAASDHNDRLGSFSNYGATTVDLAAPGVGILSTTPNNGYKSFNGTSMATPHVAGAAALLLAKTPTLTVAQVKDRLLSSVDKVAALNGKVLTGGRLNVDRALGVTALPAKDKYEADDTQAAAKGIAANSAQSRTIHAPGNADWVKFTLTTPMNVVLETSGAEGDTEMWLYGPNSTTLVAYHNDKSTADRFSRIARTALPTGTYYVQVRERGNDGTLPAYTLRLTVSVGDPFEVDNTPGYAKVIAAGQSQARSIHAAGNVDWVKFVLAASSNVVLETAGAAGDTEMWLYGPNSATKTVAYNNDKSATNKFSRIAQAALAAGTYYVRVQEAGNNATIAAYTLKLTATGVAAAGDAYEYDDGPGKAKGIAANTTQNRSIHVESDTDWVKFTLSATSNVVIETFGTTGDTEMWVYASTDTVSPLAYSDDKDLGNLFSRIPGTGVAPGSYFIKIRSYNNEAKINAYQLKLTVTPG